MKITKKTATRDSYGKALVSLGEKDDRVVVLEADLAGATKTSYFRERFPEHHIECGIAEANMTCIAAGLSLTGNIPFLSSFAMFAAGRAYEQVRNSIGYPHLNVKIAATHGGISVGEDGATHQCNEDLALMRTIPGMVVLNPADDTSARAAVMAAAEYEGPVYLRFGRPEVPVIYDESFQFEIGKAYRLKEGTDITIAATGLCVWSALEAAEKLQEQGISAEVIDFPTVKPLDEETLLASAAKTGIVVTAEEHSIIGGFGSAVCDCLSEKLPVPVYKIGMRDVYGQSAPAEQLLHRYQLDGEGVYLQTLEYYNRIRKVQK